MTTTGDDYWLLRPLPSWFKSTRSAAKPSRPITQLGWRRTWSPTQPLGSRGRSAHYPENAEGGIVPCHRQRQLANGFVSL